MARIIPGTLRIHLWAHFPGRGTGTRGTPSGDPAVEMIDADKDGGADILVLRPRDSVDSDEALVVIVKQIT